MALTSVTKRPLVQTYKDHSRAAVWRDSLVMEGHVWVCYAMGIAKTMEFFFLQPVNSYLANGWCCKKFGSKVETLEKLQ